MPQRIEPSPKAMVMQRSSKSSTACPSPLRLTTGSGFDVTGKLFIAAYPLASRSLRVRFNAAKMRLVESDREDAQQEVLMRVWQALHRYDPSRSSLRTFTERVVANRFVSIRRSWARRPTHQSLEDAEPHRQNHIAQVELRTDLGRALRQLPEKDRRIARLLVEYSPTEVGRLTGTSRAQVYRQIQRIRRALIHAGIGSAMEFGH